MGDHNGKMIHEWLNEYDLILLNYDDKCVGEVTWRRPNGSQESTVDYILVNEEIYDRSDHKLLSARFQIKRKERKKRSKREIKREYYSKESRLLSQFRIRLEEEWTVKKPENVIEMTQSMNKIANEILKKIYRKRELNGEINNEEKPWMNDIILNEIKKRRK